MDDTNAPGLFGLTNTNRNFTNKQDWGKNVFNNTFPASLLCYLNHKNIKPVYLKLTPGGAVVTDYIDAEKVLGANFQEIYFMFESTYPPYENFVSGHLPRTDLVTFKMDADMLPVLALQDIEIKLTAVPDFATSDASVTLQGPEIVVRPDTIVYLAMSIIQRYIDKTDELIEHTKPITDRVENWNSQTEIKPLLQDIAVCLKSIMQEHIDLQQPILIQPIWRTVGKSLELADDAFDVFVWSNFAFATLFIDQVSSINNDKITRPQRAMVWLFKMLSDYAINGSVDHSAVIRNINYNSQTDKAFALNGRVTNSYLRSPELITPRIKKHELSRIILNEGYEMLSPERRFDASVISNISLFNR